MIEIHDDCVMACTDCYTLVATGDATFLDEYYSPKKANRRLKEIENAISTLQSVEGTSFSRLYLEIGDEERNEEFSWSSCDVCGTSLGGSRYHMVVLGEKD